MTFDITAKVDSTPNAMPSHSNIVTLALAHTMPLFASEHGANTQHFTKTEHKELNPLRIFWLPHNHRLHCMQFENKT